jgi:hypothetical protein
MKRALLFTGLMALMTTFAMAADLTGKWTGQFDFNGNAVPLTFDLKSDGAALTGKVNGLPTENIEIKDGKIDGTTVTFWIVTDYQGNAVKLVLNGKISEDKIDLTMATEDGGFSVSFPIKKAAS